jgi:hypothetical protein
VSRNADDVPATEAYRIEVSDLPIGHLVASSTDGVDGLFILGRSQLERRPTIEPVLEATPQRASFGGFGSWP